MILFVNLGLCVFISKLTVPTSQSNALLHFIHLKLMIVFSMLLFIVFPSLFDSLRPTISMSSAPREESQGTAAEVQRRVCSMLVLDACPSFRIGGQGPNRLLLYGFFSPGFSGKRLGEGADSRPKTGARSPPGGLAFHAFPKKP